jgi:hypothetical protein
MKINKLLSLMAISVFTFNAVAQKAVTITETTESIGEESGNALRAVIYGADEKTIFKSWKSIMKNHDAIVKTKKNEMYATEVLISSISDHKISVFAKIKDVDRLSKEVLFIFKKTDEIVSSSSDISGYTSAKEMVLTFATAVSKKAAEDFLKDAQKTLGKLEGDYEELTKQKQKAEKEIEECKETITNNEYNIQENIKNQKNKIEEIEKQKVILRKAKYAKEIFE